MSEAAYRRALEILAAYFSGTLDDELMKDIRRWLISGRGGKAKHEALYRFFEEGFQFQETPPEEAYRSFEEVSKRLGLQEMSDDEYDRLARKIYNQPTVAKTNTTRRLLTGSRMWRVAAVMIPVLMIAGASWLWFSRPQPAPQIAMVTMAVPDTLGAQGRIDLADGTDLFIRPGSEISHAEDFNAGDKRRVVLAKGEVYLNVAKDSLRQFVVETPHLNVNVLGTSFNVESAPDKQFTIVTLYTGQVRIDGIKGDGVTEIQMGPGKRLVYNNATGEYKIEETVAILPEWIAQRLTFTNTPLCEVFRAIEWYWGVKVETDELLDLNTAYTFRFDGRENIETAMSILENINLDLDFSIGDDKVKVTAKK